MPYTSDWSILSKVKKARILTTCFFTLDKIDFLMEVAEAHVFSAGAYTYAGTAHLHCVRRKCRNQADLRENNVF